MPSHHTPLHPTDLIKVGPNPANITLHPSLRTASVPTRQRDSLFPLEPFTACMRVLNTSSGKVAYDQSCHPTREVPAHQPGRHSCQSSRSHELRPRQCMQLFLRFLDQAVMVWMALQLRSKAWLWGRLQRSEETAGGFVSGVSAVVQKGATRLVGAPSTLTSQSTAHRRCPVSPWLRNHGTSPSQDRLYG